MTFTSLLKTTTLLSCLALPVSAGGLPTTGPTELVQTIAEMQFLAENHVDAANAVKPLKFGELYAFPDAIKMVVVSDPQSLSIQAEGHALLVKPVENITPDQVFVAVLLQDGTKIGLGDPSLMKNIK